MIMTELDTVWITSDGKKFLYEKEAKAHEQKYIKEQTGVYKKIGMILGRWAPRSAYHSR